MLRPHARNSSLEGWEEVDCGSVPPRDWLRGRARSLLPFPVRRVERFPERLETSIVRVQAWTMHMVEAVREGEGSLGYGPRA